MGQGNQRGDKQGSGKESGTTPRTRVLKRNQQVYEFPYYLKDITDARERDRQSKQFMDQTLLDWTCNQCHNKGHTKDICPRFFKLDEHSIEGNPRSFFFGLRPPHPVLALRHAAKVMPVLTPTADMVLPSAGASPHTNLSSIELDPQEYQRFLEWRAIRDPTLGN
jgi:hypothetical protein